MPWAPQPSEQPADFAYDNWSQHLAPAFRAALQNIYGRGMDISSNAPWQVLDQAFPRAGSAQLRQSHDADLMDAARMFMSGQTPQKPGMLDRPPMWTDDASQSSGGVAGGPDATSPSSAVGALAGYTGPATSIFGSVMGGPFSGVPSLGIALGTALASGQLPGQSSLNNTLNAINGPYGHTSAPQIDLTNPVSKALEQAFPLSQKTAEGRMEPAVPVSPSFFNTAFTTPANLQAAIVSALNTGNITADNALEAGVTPSQTQADAIASALQALALGLPTVSPGLGMNANTAPGQASQHGNESFAMNALSMTPQARSDAPPTDEGIGSGVPGVGPPGLDDGGMGGVGSGAAPSGASTGNAGIGAGGASGTGGTGTSGGVGAGGSSGTGPGGTGVGASGQAYRGGPIADKRHKGFKRSKGSHVVPIDAHEGEFVVNANATKAAKPALEALNSLIPSNPRNREDLEEIVKRAAKYFDVA